VHPRGHRSARVDRLLEAQDAASLVGSTLALDEAADLGATRDALYQHEPQSRDRAQLARDREARPVGVRQSPAQIVYHSTVRRTVPIGRELSVHHERSVPTGSSPLYPVAKDAAIPAGVVSDRDFNRLEVEARSEGTAEERLEDLADALGICGIDKSGKIWVDGKGVNDQADGRVHRYRGVEGGDLLSPYDALREGRQSLAEEEAACIRVLEQASRHQGRCRPSGACLLEAQPIAQQAAFVIEVSLAGRARLDNVAVRAEEPFLQQLSHPMRIQGTVQAGQARRDSGAEFRVEPRSPHRSHGLTAANTVDHALHRLPGCRPRERLSQHRLEHVRVHLSVPGVRRGFHRGCRLGCSELALVE
jgi:hypothetical protein